VYGVGRTLLALGTALTLIFTRSSTLFRPAAGLPTAPFCSEVSRLSIFCAMPPGRLELARWISVAILLLVASGWRPRVTGLLHWWISFSLQSSAIGVDGGDQATCILTLLLLPVTLTDPRAWHWKRSQSSIVTTADASKRIIALSALAITRLQVAGIYFHAAVGKFKVPEWVDGTGLYYFLTSPVYGASDWLMPLLRPLLMNGITVSLLTWSVLLTEILLAAGLVIRKERWPVLLTLGIVLHALIGVVLGLISFALAMIGALVLYLRPIEKPVRFSWLKSVWRSSLAGRLQHSPRNACIGLPIGEISRNNLEDQCSFVEVGDERVEASQAANP